MNEFRKREEERRREDLQAEEEKKIENEGGCRLKYCFFFHVRQSDLVFSQAACLSSRPRSRLEQLLYLEDGAPPTGCSKADGGSDHIAQESRRPGAETSRRPVVLPTGTTVSDERVI